MEMTIKNILHFSPCRGRALFFLFYEMSTVEVLRLKTYGSLSKEDTLTLQKEEDILTLR